jgi:hypothetical protein
MYSHVLIYLSTKISRVRVSLAVRAVAVKQQVVVVDTISLSLCPLERIFYHGRCRC